MADISTLAELMGDLDEDGVKEILQEVMAEGGEQAQEAMEECQKGMNIIGERFETNEYFVGDLIYAGELMTDAVDILKDGLLDGSDGTSAGKLILATVKDDLHDIGKNIVRSILEASGFEVIDLGIDVAPETIVKAVQDNDVKIVALSGVLTLALDSMRATVDALADAGLRDTVHVVVGGACVNEDAIKITGADEWAVNPQKTVNVCKEWSEAA